MTAKKQVIAIAVAVAAVIALYAVRASQHVDPWSRLTADGARRTGSISLPRGGRYVFGYQGEGKVRITVANRPVPVQPGDGALKGSVDLDAGVVPFTVDGYTPGLRLLWHPPGRRGDLEYLPASSLSPSPPETATFDRPGTSILDGLIAIGLGCVAGGLALYLGWPRLRVALRAHRRVALGALAIFAIALGVRLYDLGGAGQTFDEDVNWSAGRNYVTNVVAGDASQRSWIWNAQHPPVMKYLAGVGAQLADGYGPARAISALALALACALLVPIGARLWNLRAGVAAGVIASLTPHLIAHAKVVGHESPTVLWWTLALWLCLRAHDDPARFVRRLVGIGVVLGIAICSRFTNLLLAPMIGVTLLVLAPPERRARTIALGFAILPVVAVVVGFVLWPRLWSHPIAHLQESWAKLSQTHAKEPFLGAWTETPPRWYFLAYLWATAPLGVLAGVAGFGARAGLRRDEWRASVIVLALFAIPLAIAFSPVRQDGVRYVMPCLVALALMAGAGVEWLAARLAGGLAWAVPADRRAARGRRAFTGVLAAITLYLGVTCARVHPYYLDYYGEQVGGPAGVWRAHAYELGWWGEGVDDAVAYVGAHAAPDERVYRDCIEAMHLAWWPYPLWGNLIEARRKETIADADWWVVQPAGKKCGVPKDATLVHTVSAMGAPLVRVYHRARPDQ